MESFHGSPGISPTHTPMKGRFTIFLHALAFVLGFTIIFVIGWGGAATLLGGLFREYKEWIARIGGVVLIFFGLATMDIIRVPWFYMDTRPEFRGKTGTFAGSLAMGLFFAAGWSPCIGATLGAILTLGYSQDTMWQSMVLSSGYSLGLGIPWWADHSDRNTVDICANDCHCQLGNEKRSILGHSRSSERSARLSDCSCGWSVVISFPMCVALSARISGVSLWARAGRCEAG